MDDVPFELPSDVDLDLARTPEAAAAPRDLTGTSLNGRYQLLDVVGGGGMGTVYRAVEVHTQHEVAVKVLDPRFDPSKDPIYRERFLREARLSTRLSHGNIVEVRDTGESDGVHFIVMELLRGRTLAQVLDQERRLGWERSIKLLRQVAAGLAFAHELGLVHRDLKPANCFVLGTGGEDELLKLLDFGLAKPVANTAGDNEVTRPSMVMGSPTYMAPEQARGEASVQADIYAIGVMLFRMLAGQAPFEGPTAIDVIVQHIQAPLPWLREVCADVNVPMELELVMRRCLEKDPRARYASVQALLFALDEAEAHARGRPARRLATQQLPAMRSATPPPPPPAIAPVLPPPPPLGALGPPITTRTPTVIFTAVREPKRRSWLVWSGAALGLIAIAALVWRSSQPEETASAEANPAEGIPAAATAAARAPERPAGPRSVSFRINSIPTGATVKVGSKLMGTTPTTFEMPTDESGEATAELTLEAKGYQTITFIATSSGPRFDLIQRLQKGSGRVQLPRHTSATAPRDDEAEEATSVPIPLGVTTAPAGHLEAPQASTAAPAPARSAEAGLESPVSPAPAPEARPPAEPVPGRVYGAEELTTRPRLVDAGRPPLFTGAARVVRAEGTAVARCVVNPQGRLERCRMVKSVPLMDEAILTSLTTRTYEPGRVGTAAVASEVSIVLRVESR